MDFSKRLIEWYQACRRELPWRKTQEPYRIWLSEIILQQTRVEQGLRYYEAFLERFPNVHHLAEASEEEVLKMWQGLGYYTRARNLHRTARYIAWERNGEFPSNFEGLRGLQGVGPYTAAAIGSFCFGLRTPVADGNVERVIARIKGLEEPVNTTKGKRRVQELASEMMEDAEPGAFNQAIMEFGALHCTPKNPDCKNCTFKKECEAYRTGKTEALPVKRKGKGQRNRYFNYLYLRNEDGVVLEQRREKDIWQHLYQLPLIESKGPLKEAELRKDQLPAALFSKMKGKQELVLQGEYRHALSHQKIHARFWSAPVPKEEWPGAWFQVPARDLRLYAFPRLIERFLG